MTLHAFRLHHVGIVVPDLEASAAWYRQHLGFAQESAYELPGSRALMIVLGAARLELIQADDAAPITRDRQEVATTLNSGGTNHLALAVDDLDALVATLEAEGVEIALPPSDVPNESGDRFAFIRDNERMLVELFQPHRMDEVLR